MRSLYSYAGFLVEVIRDKERDEIDWDFRKLLSQPAS